ncbi:hypothetical protein [Microbulbifer sp. DLAB2-AA]|uniref:hypothetical protein n=1 Tax=Microbulbifer sp. DLAB2-AA TaxID=3243394 RepID=UPI00403937C9
MTLINNKVTKSELAVVGIYGAGGSNAGDNQALRAWVTEMGGAMFGPTEKSKARDFLMGASLQQKHLLLLGYSRGGTTAINLANLLGRKGISLNHLIIFDAHSVFDNRIFYLRYDNVQRAINFLQRNPRSAGRYGWWGTNPYWGSPLVSNFIKVQEIDFTGAFFRKGMPVSHLNIVRQSLASL